MSSNTFRTITANQIPDYIELAWDVMQKTSMPPVIYLQGPPGVGKSAAVNIAAERLAKRTKRSLVRRPKDGVVKKKEFGLWVTQMANSSEEVISGLPWVDKDENRQRRATVGSFPNGDNSTGIWFCDEPLQASYTQRFLAQLVYGQQIDEYYEMPKNVLLVMAGNSSKDRAGVTKMWTHFANRVMILHVVPDVNGAINNFHVPVTPEVGSYLLWFPDKLYKFDAKKHGPFPSPRTWDFVNTLISSGVSPKNNFPAFQGYLGHEEAVEFEAIYDAMKKLPDIARILKNPEEFASWAKATWNNDPHVLTALSFVVLRKLKEQRDVATASSTIALLSFARAELAASFLALAKGIDDEADDGKSVHNSPEYAKFVAEHSKLMSI